MYFQQFDLNLLVALDALLKERSITEAGRRVHLSQSAMSGALARLREYFGDELLTQVGRKMVPTPLAVSLAEPVREILLRSKLALAMTPAFDPATSKRHFVLMMSDYVSTVLMPRLYRRLEQAAPDVQLEILSNDVGNPLDSLDRADVDLLIMPAHLLPKTHPSELLYEDTFVCIAWADNPLIGEAITQDQYLLLGHVVAKLSHSGAPLVDEWFLTRLGVKRRIEITTMNFNAIAQAVVGTRRVATIQRRLAEFYATYLPLRILALPYELPNLLEAMQWHTHFDADPGMIWLRQILKEASRTVA